MRAPIWLAAALVVATAHAASAGNDADCSYLEISATSGKQPAIDGELRPLEKKLKKPPFASWNVFHKLSSGPIALDKLKAVTLGLREGSASVLLRDRTDKRLELTITVDGPEGKRVLDTKPSLTAGDWLVLATTAKDDGHLLALTCK